MSRELCLDKAEWDNGVRLLSGVVLRLLDSNLAIRSDTEPFLLVSAAWPGTLHTLSLSCEAKLN